MDGKGNIIKNDTIGEPSPSPSSSPPESSSIPTELPPENLQKGPSGLSKLTTPAKIGIGVGVSLGVASVASVGLFLFLRRGKKFPPIPPVPSNVHLAGSVPRHELPESCLPVELEGDIPQKPFRLSHDTTDCSTNCSENARRGSRNSSRHSTHDSTHDSTDDDTNNSTHDSTRDSFCYSINDSIHDSTDDTIRYSLHGVDTTYGDPQIGNFF